MSEKIAADPRWKEYGAEEWSDALVAAMKLGGVEHLFFVSGSEIAFWQESVAKAQQRGWPAPRLITVLHEAVALNAALGSSMVSNQPAATAVHVDVGTLNYGGAIHGMAWTLSGTNHCGDRTARLSRVDGRIAEQWRAVGTGAEGSGRDRSAVYKSRSPFRASGQSGSDCQPSAATGDERTQGPGLFNRAARDGDAPVWE